MWVSHLTVTDYRVLRTALGVRTHLRVGTRLWLGEKRAYRTTATVLDVHRIRRGAPLGYHGVKAPRDGWIVIASGGTAHGLAMTAPTPQRSLRQRGVTVAQGVLDSLGRSLSPFTIGGRKRAFAEPPHMHSSMVFVPGAEEKKRFLERLTAAETLERYLHTRYVGQKRFSLEGGESTIVALDELVRVAGSLGVQEIAVGMAHRGRLNVLVNTLGKAPQMLFDEFEGKKSTDLAAGDVKYHMGFSSDLSTPGGPVHLTLAFNPSHLEIVNPVVEGSVYARQRRRGTPGALEP